LLALRAFVGCRTTLTIRTVFRKATQSGRRTPPGHGAYLLAMQTFLAKCAALAVLLGGFFATGDVAKLAEQGRKLLNATTVPEASLAKALPPEPAAAAPYQAAASAPPQPAPPPMQPEGQSAVAAMPTAPEPAPTPPPRAPLGHRITRPAPPANSPLALELRSLRAGDRLLVWIGRSPSTTAVIAYDIVDPAAGEALEHRHLFEDEDAAVHAVPRRVQIAGDSMRSGWITRGGMLRLLPAGIVHSAGAAQQAEMLGPLQAMQVQR
jgi:hypothetical protein